MQTVKGRDTALHLAIADRRIDVIAAIIEKFKEGGDDGGGHRRRPNLDLKNAEDQTPLSMALSRGLHEIAMDLLRGGTLCNFAFCKMLTEQCKCREYRILSPSCRPCDFQAPS